MDTFLSQYNKYIENSKILYKIIKQVIDDYVYVQEGGVIISAVDFSEIYAYLLPQADIALAKEFKIVSDNNIDDAKLIQRLVLHDLLYKYDPKIVLLTPYAMEIEGFLAKVREGAYDDIIDRCLETYDQLVKLPGTELFNKVFGVVSKYSISDDELEVVLDYLKMYAPSLINILNPPWSEPLSIMRELLGANVFQNLSDLEISKIDITPDKEITRRWYDKLINIRGQERIASSILDAEAIGAIYHANSILFNNNMKLVLQTRSMIMHEILTDEINSGELSDKYGYLLRHPLSTYFKYGQNNRSIIEISSELEKYLKPLEFILYLAEDDKPNKEEISQYYIDQIQNRLREISKTWKSSGALDALSGYSINHIDYSQKPQLIQAVYEFFTRISNSVEIRNYMVKKLNDLHEQLRRANQYLGLFTEVGSARVVETNLGLKKYGEKFVLGTNRQAMPYTFQFYSSDAEVILQKFGIHESYSLDDALPIIIEGFSSEANFERLLAMSFILGSLSKWKEAERYCQEALSEKYIANDVHPHEGYFLLAICKRKYSPSYKRHQEALELLSKALHLKRGWKNNPQYQDPRYIHELGLQVIKCRLNFYNEIKEEDHFPAVEDGLNYIEAALRISEADKYLIVQGSNNLLYYYLNQGLLENRNKLMSLLDTVYNTQLEIQTDLKKWPGFILDTVALAKWKLYGIDNCNIEEIIHLFTIANNDPHLDIIERSEVEEHLTSFLASIKNHQ